MKRSTIIYLVILLVVLAVAAIVILNPKKGTIPQALTGFAVQDTAAVDKIFLADKHGNKILLERTGPGSWMVNKKYVAYKERIDILLETIRLVEVKNPVPLSARETYMKVLATDGIKTEIYQHGKLVKTYYVGGTTPDELGTIMMLENSSEPFVTHIPGFYGYLSIRYFTEEIDWRNRDVFAYSPSKITMVEMQYTGFPNLSFRMTKEADNKFYIKSLDERKPKQEVPALTASSYFMKYSVVEFENFVDMKPEKRDSMALSAPFMVITVKAEGQKDNQLKLFRKQADKRTKTVGPGNIDEDKYYGIMNGKQDEILLIQYNVIEKIFRTYSNFIPE
jgi:hypothetical protein